MTTMDYKAPQNVSGEIVSKLFEQGNKTALFSGLVAKIKHIDTKIVNSLLRIQGWVPLSSFINEFPKGENIDMSFSISKETIDGCKISVVEVWSWAIPLWYFYKNKETAYEIAQQIPHNGIITENDFAI